MTDQLRTLAGRYDLGEVLGRGGMADVHRAHDTLLDRAVAVKVLRAGADSETDRLRFASEVRLLGRLSHRGLVTALDAGTTEGGQLFLVMELVEGPTLRRLLDAGPMVPERVAEVGAQLATALAHAHAHQVVHRDVKPGNVLVDVSGRVKLADFGIARVIGDTVHHTRTGQAIGTAAYLSPEQVTGAEVGSPADVYSLGLVLLEALTGRKAFTGSPTEAAFARLSQSPEVPTSLPSGWRRLLTAMTATAPDERPRAADVAIELATGSPGATDATDATDIAVETRPFATAVSGAPMPRHLRSASAAVVALILFVGAAALVAHAGPEDSQAASRRPAATASPSPASSATPSLPTAPATPASSPVAPAGSAPVNMPGQIRSHGKAHHPPKKAKKGKKAKRQASHRKH